ncbi:MAG: ester cyclase [Actinobacteria bacterium]|nr:ester cyclase [Actinomycetota bacterium]
MTSAERNKAIVRRVTELIEKERNIEGLDDVLAEDFVNHSPSPGFAPDREGFKQNAADVYGAFDLTYTSDFMVAVDDLVVERWTESGPHTGTYFGVPPTGRHVVVTGIEIWRLRDGKIVERWAEVNELELLRKVGLLDGVYPDTP